MVVGSLHHLIEDLVETESELNWIEDQKFFMNDPETELFELRQRMKAINNRLTEIIHEE